MNEKSRTIYAILATVLTMILGFGIACLLYFVVMR